MSFLGHHLFVYGTLRRDSGHPMAAYLAKHARFLDSARAPGRLYDLGTYPGMLPASAVGDWVHGEVFELTDPAAILAELDRYEGCMPEHPQPYIFERVLATVRVGEDRALEAWVYLYALPVTEEQRVLSGRYQVQSIAADGEQPSAY